MCHLSKWVNDGVIVRKWNNTVLGERGFLGTYQVLILNNKTHLVRHQTATFLLEGFLSHWKKINVLEILLFRLDLSSPSFPRT